MLLSLLVAEKSGFQLTEHLPGNVLQEFADKISKQDMDNMEEAMSAEGLKGLGSGIDLSKETVDAPISVTEAARPKKVEPKTVAAKEA
jgi:hypothetical protein